MFIEHFAKPFMRGEFLMANLIITCEHGGNKIPDEWKDLFPQPCPELMTHRGYDIGALKIAKHLAEAFSAPLFYNEITRLLIDFNRSVGHRSQFSEFSRRLSKAKKNQIIETYYLPYRQNIEHTIRPLLPAVHLSVHSFTPQLKGKVRDVDIGLLYDPKRPSEKELAYRWKRNIPKNYRVKMNQPYLGISDGLIPEFRKQFDSPEYIGLELEVNQDIISKDVENILKESLGRTL